MPRKYKVIIDEGSLCGDFVAATSALITETDFLALCVFPLGFVQPL